jgi:hypothetical protein
MHGAYALKPRHAFSCGGIRDRTQKELLNFHQPLHEYGHHKGENGIKFKK